MLLGSQNKKFVDVGSWFDFSFGDLVIPCLMILWRLQIYNPFDDWMFLQIRFDSILIFVYVSEIVVGQYLFLFYLIGENSILLITRCDAVMAGDKLELFLFNLFRKKNSYYGISCLVELCWVLGCYLGFCGEWASDLWR